MSGEAALALLSALRLEDGRAWGAAAAAFQLDDARAVLDPDSSTPYHFLTRSRGAAKTSDLGGMAVAAMLAQLPPRSRCYAIAADRDQGRLLLDSIAGYAARTRELRGALALDSFRVTATRSGSVLDVLAADEAGAWGLRPAFVVVDELPMWPTTSGARRLFEAVSSAAAKLPGCRMVLLGTAGDPTHWSRKVLDHALADPLWRVHEVPGPAPWLDPARLAEQKRRLPNSIFARLFENRWTSSEDRLATVEELRACVTLDGPQPPRPGTSYALGLDIGLKHDRTVAAVCHREGPRIVLYRMQTWQGSRRRPVRLAEVEEWVGATALAYNRAILVADPWQSVAMMQRLRAQGVRVVEYTFSAQSVGRLASTLLLLLRDRALALPDDEALLDELANVRLRETSPGVLRLDHDSGLYDDRAIALALAATHLIERRRPTIRSVAVAQGGIADAALRRLQAEVPTAPRVAHVAPGRPTEQSSLLRDLLAERLAGVGIPPPYGGL